MLRDISLFVLSLKLHLGTKYLYLRNKLIKSLFLLHWVVGLGLGKKNRVRVFWGTVQQMEIESLE